MLGLNKSTGPITRVEEDLGAAATLIHPVKTVCKNSNEEFASGLDIIKTNTGAFTISDVDAELLFMVTFNEPVVVTNLSFKATEGPAEGHEFEDASGPSDVYVFANKESLDFNDATELRTQAFHIQLKEADLKGDKKIALPGVRFQRCSSIQVFVSANQKSTDYTFLNRLQIFGYAIGHQ